MWKTLGNVHYFDYVDTSVTYGDGHIAVHFYPARIESRCGYVAMGDNLDEAVDNDILAFYKGRYSPEPFVITDRQYPDWAWQFIRETLEKGELGHWYQFGDIEAFFSPDWQPSVLTLPGGRDIKWRLVPVAVPALARYGYRLVEYANGYAVVLDDNDDDNGSAIVFTITEPVPRNLVFELLSYDEQYWAIDEFGKDGARALFNAATERLQQDFRLNYEVRIPYRW